MYVCVCVFFSVHVCVCVCVCVCILVQAGVTMSEGMVQPEMLEHFVREELNRTACRVMAVLHPLKVVITNFPYSEVPMMMHGVNIINCNGSSEV